MTPCFIIISPYKEGTVELIIGSNHMQEVEGISAQYPYVLNHADSRDTRVPWHWHEELEFSYIRQGSLRVTISGRSFLFHRGEGFFINSNILHAMEPADPAECAIWDSHMFHPIFLGGYYRSVFDTKYLSAILKNQHYELAGFTGESENQKAILALLQQAAAVQDEEFHEFKIRNLFSDIWILLMKELEDLENSAKLIKHVSQERIQIMLAYIHQHYPERITLEQIADAAIISKRECLRCFQSCIQKTPFEYLLDYRVQMAEKLLRTTALPITQIALDTGFSNSAYFAKTFRQLRGISPSHYRKQVQS